MPVTFSLHWTCSPRPCGLDSPPPSAAPPSTCWHSLWTSWWRPPPPHWGPPPPAPGRGWPRSPSGPWACPAPAPSWSSLITMWPSLRALTSLSSSQLGTIHSLPALLRRKNLGRFCLLLLSHFSVSYKTTLLQLCFFVSLERKTITQFNFIFSDWVSCLRYIFQVCVFKRQSLVSRYSALAHRLAAAILDFCVHLYCNSLYCTVQCTHYGSIIYCTPIKPVMNDS